MIVAMEPLWSLDRCPQYPLISRGNAQRAPKPAFLWGIIASSCPRFLPRLGVPRSRRVALVSGPPVGRRTMMEPYGALIELSNRLVKPKTAGTVTSSLGHGHRLFCLAQRTRRESSRGSQSPGSRLNLDH
jgi:hypothetical protein